MQLQVPAGATTIDVEFALLSWDREAESRFRTQLIGLEDAPTSWTPQPSRSFSALPPGDYRLRIEARAVADGLIEAFSARPCGADVLAVQWHPEWNVATSAANRAFFSLIGQSLEAGRER